MDRLKHIFAICLFLSNITFATAQNNQYENETLNSSESVFVHINATSFVSGEKLFYKLYLLNSANNKVSSLSKIAYVELISADKKIIFGHKLFLEEGKSQGDFLIPSDLQTGNYKLVAYTKWMLNKNKEKFFESEIYIINPFEKLNPELVSKSESKDSLQNTTNLKIESTDSKFEITKKRYSKREKITLKTPNLENGDFSLSVRKVDDLPKGKKITSEEFNKYKSSENINFSKTNILPELRGEMIIGKIISKSKLKDVKNKTVSLSITGKNFVFLLAKTNSDGNFIFNINKPHYSTSVFFQIVDEDQKEYDIVIEKSNSIVLNSLSFEKSLTLSPDLRIQLQERSIASQIENAYQSKKIDSTIIEQKYEAFYEPIAKNYFLDNYTRFKTLKETTIEIVPEMYFSKKANHYFLHLSDNFGYSRSDEPALVLIDGLLIQNTDELYEYDSNLIHLISVKPGEYYYANKIFNGIVSIVTKNNDFTSTNPENIISKPSIQRPISKKLYFKQDHSDVKQERIPDYRNQLLWLTDANRNETISFYTSDVSGTFEITLEGFTETGKPISEKEYFEVK